MKTIMRNTMSPKLLIVVGLAISLVGSYQVIASTITCSLCAGVAWDACNSDFLAPGGQPTCLNREEADCTNSSCRRCDGEFSDSKHICISFPGEENTCELNDDTEECGTKYTRVCFFDGDCRCPATGGDPAGVCQYQECDAW